MAEMIPMVVTRKRLGVVRDWKKGCPGSVPSKPCGNRRQIWGTPEGTALRVGHF